MNVRARWIFVDDLIIPAIYHGTHPSAMGTHLYLPSLPRHTLEVIDTERQTKRVSSPGSINYVVPEAASDPNMSFCPRPELTVGSVSMCGRAGNHDDQPLEGKDTLPLQYNGF